MIFFEKYKNFIIINSIILILVLRLLLMQHYMLQIKFYLQVHKANVCRTNYVVRCKIPTALNLSNTFSV